MKSVKSLFFSKIRIVVRTTMYRVRTISTVSATRV